VRLLFLLTSLIASLSAIAGNRPTWADCVVRLFETEPTANIGFKLVELQDGITASAVSPDKQWLAIGSKHGELFVWNLKAPSSPRILEGSDQIPHQPVVAIGIENNQLRMLNSQADYFIWDLADGARRRRYDKLPVSAGGVKAAAFLPSGILVTGNSAGTLRAYKEPFGELLWEVPQAHPSGIVGISATTVRSYGIPRSSFVSKSGNGTVSLYRANGRRVSTTQFPEPFISAQSDGVSTRIATLKNDGRVVVYEYPAAKPIFVIKNHDAAIRFTNLSLSRNGKMLFTSNQMGFGQIWDLQTGKLLADLGGEHRHWRNISKAFFAVGDSLLVTITDGPESQIKVWDPSHRGDPAADIIQINPISGGKQISLTRRLPDGTIDTQIHTQYVNGD